MRRKVQRLKLSGIKNCAVNSHDLLTRHFFAHKALDLLKRLYSQALDILKRLYSQGPWFTHKALALLAAALLTERCSAVALHPGLDHRSIFSPGPFHPLKSNHIITLVQSTLQTTAVNFHWRSNQECWATWFSSKSVDRNKIHPVIWVQPLLAIENLTWKRRLCYCYSYIFIDFLTPGLHRVLINTEIRSYLSVWSK